MSLLFTCCLMFLLGFLYFLPLLPFFDLLPLAIVDEAGSRSVGGEEVIEGDDEVPWIKVSSRSSAVM
jgi:hypothetical protein